MLVLKQEQVYLKSGERSSDPSVWFWFCRVGPAGRSEPGLAVMGAQQAPAVHPVALVALQDAAELPPAGQRRIPAGKELRGPRWGGLDRTQRSSRPVPLSPDPLCLLLNRFCDAPEPELPSGPSRPASSQPELHPAEEMTFFICVYSQ